MTTDTKLSELVINKLTTAQYDGIATKDPNQLYIVTDTPGFEESITNCITEIPQDIKLELNNGDIKILAGSILYVPNGKDSGGNKIFTKYVVEEDIVADASDGTTTSSDWFLFIHTTSKSWRNSRVVSNFSGDTAPTTSGTYAVWYDTATNYIKYTNDNGANWITTPTSLPICTFTRINGTASPIDQIFNGFGYIGKTMYVLPGVSGLAPSGRDANGKIQNLSINVTSVKTQNILTTSQVYSDIRLSNSGIGAGLLNYIFMDNINYTSTHEPYSGIKLGRLQFDGTKITQFLVKNTLRVLDYNDKSTISSWSMPSNIFVDLTLGASGAEYTAQANGYVLFERGSTSGNKYINLYNNNSQIGAIGTTIAGVANARVFIPVKKGDIFKASYSADSANPIFKLIYADGEI